MVPNTALAGFYVRVVGDETLLSIAGQNLLNNFDRVSKVRTHTFFDYNAQTKDGISNNKGAERFYSWEDTLIDCRHAPSLIDGDALSRFEENMANNARFISLKESLEKRMGGQVEVSIFTHVVRGQDNMRYNIRRASKIEDFDIVRTGLRLRADDDAAFKDGLKELEKDLRAPKPRRLHSFF